MITVANLIAAGIEPTQARQFTAPLSAACARFAINTPVRIAAFVGQCGVESALFTRLEENLFYTTPERIRAVFPSTVTSLMDAAKLTRNPKALANRVYANRLGNRDEESGDGWRYRGRGLIHLTGKSNYESAADGLNLPLVTNPEIAAEPAGACMTAAWFWHTNKLNVLADSSQWSSITRAVNGRAMLHASLRQQRTEQGIKAFS